MNRKRNNGEDYEIYRANLKIESKALTNKLKGGIIWNYITDAPYYGSMKRGL